MARRRDRERRNAHVGGATVAGAQLTAAAAGTNRLQPFEGVLDRCGVVGGVREKQLDAVDAQSLQAAGELRLEESRIEAGVKPTHVPRRDLGGKADSASDFQVALHQPTADHDFARAARVTLGCVKQRNAQPDRFIHCLERGPLVQSAADELRAAANPPETRRTCSSNAPLDATAALRAATVRLNWMSECNAASVGAASPPP